ncbi:MAG: acetylornithine carbamoyltransferase, partial [Pyrinomonadaceae bacterium]|nr:acetylornithine carbamoyltransferase [Pyrinomonadaceae bacterium]
EKFGEKPRKVLLTWAFHPKALPMAVPNSFALAAAQFGHDLTIAHPKGYELDDALMNQINDLSAANGGKVGITNDVETAFDNVEVVYAKSWGSKNYYGNLERESEYRQQFRENWIVDDAKMKRSNDAIFMHCLPVRRNVIVTDSVIDSANSVVVDEAENRLHIQKAILASLIK